MGKKVVTEMRDVWDGLIPKIIVLARQEVDNIHIQELLEGVNTEELTDGTYVCDE